jgi:hypothetical protein
LQIREKKLHKVALAQFKELLKGTITLVTSDLVVAEAQILLPMRVGADA